LGAVGDYDPAAAAAVADLKYRNRRGRLGRLATELAAEVPGGPYDVVTWAPTSRRRARTRGYDQAQLLAGAVARRLGAPHRRLLTRRGDPAPQVGRSRAQRLVAPTFVARCPAGARVLLVDDVVTTGATVSAAAAALLEAGAALVDVVCVARTGRSEGPKVLKSAPAAADNAGQRRGEGGR
jgi:predicted amidophosphoribosyltransferase